MCVSLCMMYACTHTNMTTVSYCTISSTYVRLHTVAVHSSTYILQQLYMYVRINDVHSGSVICNVGIGIISASG